MQNHQIIVGVRILPLPLLDLLVVRVSSKVWKISFLIKMAEISSFKCPEYGCKMSIDGVSEEEFQEYLNLHRDKYHRKVFDETELGRLPLEVLLKILSYIVPDCRSCFIQRDLFKLGSVCKKFNEVIKAPELYWEINLSGKCCPLPTDEIFLEMMDSGSQLKKITCNYQCRNLLIIAIVRCRNSLQKIHVEDNNIKLDVPTNMLSDISRLNPAALVEV